MLHPAAPLAIRVLLAIHILGGFTALVAAPLALAVLKGGPAHKRFGKVYLIAMAVVAFTALFVAPYFQDYFLLAIAIFSAYLAFTGWRVLSRKRPTDRPEAVDWAATVAVIAAGAALYVLGATRAADFGSFVIVLYVFGTIAIALGGSQIWAFVSKSGARPPWLANHVRFMMGAYIATVTAFSSTNLHVIHPLWLRWLWPTIIGSFVIAYYTRRYSPRTVIPAR